MRDVVHANQIRSFGLDARDISPPPLKNPPKGCKPRKSKQNHGMNGTGRSDTSAQPRGSAKECLEVDHDLEAMVCSFGKMAI